jgi:hypothetical protein
MRILLILFSILVLKGSAFGQKKDSSESIYLHVDKETYLPGEILWFKMYTVSTDELVPVFLSAVAYVDIVNGAGEVVYQSKIELGDNRNSGSIFIPLSLNTGAYKLSAYTTLSKSEGQAYSKDLRILNPFAINEPLVPTLPDALQIDFFPEGGVLVNGLQSKVGFKISDAYGRGVQSEIKIVKNGSTTVGTYSSNNLGIGSFLLSPSEGEGYTAKIAYKGKEIVKELPKPEKEGFVLLVEDNQDFYKVSVSSSKTLVNTPMVLKFGHDEQFKQEIIFQNSDKAEVSISKTKLPAGTSRLTLFDFRNRPLAERILFRSPIQVTRAKLQLNKKDFTTRDQVEVNLSGFETNRPSMSVSVIKIDDIQRAPSEDILSYLYLSKDLIGTIENPKYYFENVGEIDNLLLTQGWRKFIKSDALVESRYHAIKVKYTSKTDGTPLANSEVLLSTPEKAPMIYSAVTDDKGIATFWIKNMYGTRQLATRLRSGLASHIEILQSKGVNDPIIPLDLSHISQKSYDMYGENVQVQNAYVGKERAQFLPAIAPDTIAFYGKPDYNYLLDDYTRFVLMEEVLREFVKPVNVRKNRDNYSLRVLDEARGVYFSTDPLILLDGIPVNSANEILNYDPLKVKNIDVVAGKYFLGENIYDGIVSFSTYKNNLQDFTLDNSYSVFSYDGLQLEREYYSPVIPKDARIPDNRTQLYWNGNVTLNDTIRFNTSDIQGNYLIDIQGIDINGNVITGQAEFVVVD